MKTITSILAATAVLFAASAAQADFSAKFFEQQTLYGENTATDIFAEQQLYGENTASDIFIEQQLYGENLDSRS